MYKTVNLEINDGIAVLALNRPKAMNAFDQTLFEDVIAAVNDCASNDEVKVLVITGAGKHFSVGGDIEEMKTPGFLCYDTAMLSSSMTKAVKLCPKPVLAKVNGTAAGAGMALALAADFRILSEKSVFLSAFANIGVSGDTGCMYLLNKMVGAAKALEIMMLSEPIPADEALKLNLATKVTAPEDFDEAADAFAKQLRARPLKAVAFQKQVMFDIFYSDFEKYREMEAEAFDACAKTQDHRGAVTAFLEKKPIVFGQD